MKRIMILMLAALALAACASAPTAEQISNADYGTPITQNAAVQLVTARMRAVAKDPDALKIQCGNVHSGWTQNKFSSSSFVAGYLIDCGINGKNSFGAYVGVRDYRFVIHDGAIVRTLEEMSNGEYGPENAVDAMRNAGMY